MGFSFFFSLIFFFFFFFFWGGGGVGGGLENEFEIAVVNEPSVFEPLKFYCTWVLNYK